MICTRCQAANDASDAFCSSCGSQLTGQPLATDPAGSAVPDDPSVQVPGSTPPGHAMVAGAHIAAFSLDMRRLSQTDRIVGGASIVVLISLFLPWFGFSVYGSSFSISGVSAHGYLYLELILALAVVAYLVLRLGWDQLPVTMPIAHGPLLLIGTGVQFLLVLIAFLDKPLGLLSWDIGAYLGLIAAVAAAAPVVVPAIRSRQQNR